MNIRLHKGNAVLALFLACALSFFGLPLGVLYADEPAETSSSAPAAEQPADTAAPAADQSSEPVSSAPEQAAPATNTNQSSSSAPASSSSSSSKESSSSAKDEEKEDEADKDKEKEDEEKDKEEAEKAAKEAFEKSKSSAAAAEAQLLELPGLQAELSPFFDMLTDTWNRLQEVDANRKPFTEEREGYLKEQEDLRKERDIIVEKRETAAERKAKAVYGLMLVDEELAKTGGVDMLSVILGTSNATEAESYGYLLGKVADCIAERVAGAKEDGDGESTKIDEVNERIAAISDKIAEVDERLAATEEEHKTLTNELMDVVERGNAIAYSIERICSEARQASQDAKNEVLTLSGVDTTPNTTSAKAAKAAEEAAAAAAGESTEEKKSDIPEIVATYVEESSNWDVKDHALRVSAQEDVGAWYDAVDALAGAEGYISYGVGLDFALSEEEFVEKWAAAINEFYAQRGNPPLGGWGEEMARQAYAYHVDPRLCAAVSINESGGGAVCIRPHNAWGWGAADTDPYNLASEWASWPIAIEAWHRGMATNPYGLGSSPSVSKLSDIYCGTPIWAQRAVNSMELMYEIAKAQAAANEKEAMAVTAASKHASGSEEDTPGERSAQTLEA